MLNSEKMLASLDQQDLARAEKYFQRALKSDPKDVLLDLAEYLESIGFFPQAKEIYLQERADFPEVNINLAQIAAEDDQIEEAFLYLDQIDESSPAYLSALLVMADLYDLEGLTDVAREKLLLASQISDEPLVTFGLAEINLQLERYQEAIDGYASLDNREILEVTGVSTYQRIGRAYASLAKFEAALEFLEKALELDYQDDTAYEVATLHYDQENYQKANLYFKQLDTMNPDYEGYEYVYAMSLHAEHKTEEALRLVQQGLSKNDFDAALMLLASQLSYELHEPVQAESYLKSALDLAEDRDEVFMRLTNLYLEQERYEEVVALAADQSDSDSLLTKWNLAKAYQALEQEDEAFELYEDLSKPLADNPEFLEDYAYILREFGYLDRAKEVATAYLNLVPDDVNMANFLQDLSLGDDL